MTSTSVGIQELREVRERPLSKPLDEAVWQAWVAKGRAEDRRGRAARVKAVKWVSVAALLVAAGLWSHLTTYDVVVRFVVAAGAIVVMLNLSHARHYTFAAVFGALALLYNPVVSVFSFSGDWQRALVLASAAPFVASLAWPRVRTVRRQPMSAACNESASRVAPRKTPSASVSKRNAGSRTGNDGGPRAKAESVYSSGDTAYGAVSTGESGMKRWVGLGVIADNLCHLGAVLANREK